jgi:hypothetical protein
MIRFLSLFFIITGLSSSIFGMDKFPSPNSSEDNKKRILYSVELCKCRLNYNMKELKQFEKFTVLNIIYQNGMTFNDNLIPHQQQIDVWLQKKFPKEDTAIGDMRTYPDAAFHYVMDNPEIFSVVFRRQYSERWFNYFRNEIQKSPYQQEILNGLGLSLTT